MHGDEVAAVVEIADELQRRDDRELGAVAVVVEDADVVELDVGGDAAHLAALRRPGEAVAVLRLAPVGADDAGDMRAVAVHGRPILPLLVADLEERLEALPVDDELLLIGKRLLQLLAAFDARQHREHLAERRRVDVLRLGAEQLPHVDEIVGCLDAGVVDRRPRPAGEAAPARGLGAESFRHRALAPIRLRHLPERHVLGVDAGVDDRPCDLAAAGREELGRRVAFDCID